jgi:hypothetical protein
MAGAVQHYRTIKARRPSEKANRLIIATRWSPWRIVRSAARAPASLAGAAHHRGCGVGLNIGGSRYITPADVSLSRDRLLVGLAVH